MLSRKDLDSLQLMGATKAPDGKPDRTDAAIKLSRHLSASSVDFNLIAVNPSIVSRVSASKVSVSGTHSAESSITSNPPVQQSDSQNTAATHIEDSTLAEYRICGSSLAFEPSFMRKNSQVHHLEDGKTTASLGPVKKRFRLHRELRSLPVLRAHPELKPIAPAPALALTKTVLLALPSDAQVLNPLHVFVRQQIEVFSATASDLSLPAPGRKSRIQLRQVGLRCIHCRYLPAKDRVKRAICYPSQVSRVYHGVSDMKFDHFTQCKGLPQDLRLKLLALKEECKSTAKQSKPNKRSNPLGCASSTAQYYHDAARQLGMVDTCGGVFLSNDVAGTKFGESESSVCGEKMSDYKSTAKPPKFPPPSGSAVAILPKRVSVENISTIHHSKAESPNTTIPSTLAGTQLEGNKALPFLFSCSGSTINTNGHFPNLSKDGSCLMASPEDSNHLNPIHCFVRRHVEYFVANARDITAPAPGRKARVVLHQVGLRCIHCSTTGERVKRSVCYPANVAGIYHSISNMKFDHFGNCPGLPADERARFETLRASCGRHGGGRGSSSKNSTAQYYQDSARRLGLVDSEAGIRFQGTDGHKERAQPPTAHGSSVATDGISALMIAASVRAASAIHETAV